MKQHDCEGATRWAHPSTAAILSACGCPVCAQFSNATAATFIMSAWGKLVQR